MSDANKRRDEMAEAYAASIDIDEGSQRIAQTHWEHGWNARDAEVAALTKERDSSIGVDLGTRYVIDGDGRMVSIHEAKSDAWEKLERGE